MSIRTSVILTMVMYNLQFNISPARYVKPKEEIKNEEPEVNFLSLAPFTTNPKICLENVKVGGTVTTILHIRNSTNCDILVTNLLLQDSQFHYFYINFSFI